MMTGDEYWQQKQQEQDELFAPPPPAIQALWDKIAETIDFEAEGYHERAGPVEETAWQKFGKTILSKGNSTQFDSRHTGISLSDSGFSIALTIEEGTEPIYGNQVKVTFPDGRHFRFSLVEYQEPEWEEGI